MLRTRVPSRTHLRYFSPIFWGIAGVAIAFAGCGDITDADQPETTGSVAPDVKASPLDNDASSGAILNEKQLASGGIRLEGRVWHAPDSYVGMYVDDEGKHLSIVSMRAGAASPSKELERKVGESFSDYATRVTNGHVRSTTIEGSNGPDVLAFEPSPTRVSPEVTVRTGAIIGNQFCDRGWFDNFCSTWSRRFGSHLDAEWRLTDKSTTQTRTGTVWALNATVCADVGNVDMFVTNRNVRYGGTPTSIAVTVNQGFVHGYSWVGGWREVEYCASHFLGVCVDYKFWIEYQNWNTTVTARPWSGGEAHFCGKFTSIPDWDEGDFSCRELARCPG